MVAFIFYIILTIIILIITHAKSANKPIKRDCFVLVIFTD